MAEARSTTRRASGGAARRSTAKGATTRRSTAKSGSAKRSPSAAKRSSSASTAAKRSTAAKKGAAKKSATTRRAAASKAGKASGRRRTATKAARRTAVAASPAAEFSGKSVAEFREALTKNLIRPLDLVLITRDRIQEVVDDAVKRGRLTTDDAEDVVRSLIERGRRQTDDVLRDLEQLLGRSPRGAATRARKEVGRARKRAVKRAEPVLAQADRARRAAGVGPSFPITAYDDMSAAQVQGRLASLTPAELRKVRDYERRNANRKSVLSAVEKKLS